MKYAVVVATVRYVWVVLVIADCYMCGACRLVDLCSSYPVAVRMG